MRTEGQWRAWFERREGKRKKKPGREITAPSNPKTRETGIPLSGLPLPTVVREASFIAVYPGRSNILRMADQRRRNPTPAEDELRRIMNRLNGGVLRGRFKREHVISGKWIVDFYFPEIRLAIEVDGSVHSTKEQSDRDRLKDSDCARFDISMLRITNREVFGDRKALIEKLREGWRTALKRENKIIGMDAGGYLASRRKKTHDGM